MRALVECLDQEAHEIFSRFALPSYGGELEWIVRNVDTDTHLRKALVIFVVASDARAAAVARRVERYRSAGHFAIGADASGSTVAIAPLDGVIGLKSATWRRGIWMLLTSVTALFFEGAPEAVVCIDWGDVRDALDRPGNLIFEWSSRPNADAVRDVVERTKFRLSGNKCSGMICLLGGGHNRWLKELRAAGDACYGMLDDGGILLGGDRIAPFGGGTGCCLLAVAD